MSGEGVNTGGVTHDAGLNDDSGLDSGRGPAHVPSYRSSTADHDNESGDEMAEDQRDHRSFSMDGDVQPHENLAQIKENIQQSFDADDLALLHMALKNTPNGVEIYSINPLTPGVNGPLQLSVNVNQTTNAVTISMATVDPILLKKIDKFTANRKFTVKSCESIETAKALLKKYGDKLVFDDNDPMIAAFKEQLKREVPGIGIKFTKDSQPAAHHGGPGHHGGL